MAEIRIAWRIADRAGGGTWHPATERQRAFLAAHVEAANRAHGPGSHWIETRQA